MTSISRRKKMIVRLNLERTSRKSQRIRVKMYRNLKKQFRSLYLVLNYRGIEMIRGSTKI